MSQHDFEIANQGFPATRADLNNALQALASNSAGTSEPTTTYAYQFWYDDTNDLLKLRNSDDDAWITLAAFDQTNDEWEIRSAVIQAVDSAGVVIKTDDGTTRLTIADDGSITTQGDLTVGGDLDASGGTIKLDGNYPVGGSNVALGDGALDDGSLSGNNNTAIGANVLGANTTGGQNSGVGRGVLLNNTSGSNNIAMGHDAMALNTTGGGNVGIGRDALLNNTTASNNTAVGYQSGYSNTTGTQNVALGDSAFFTNTTGSYNTALGRSALLNSTTADSNTAVGQSALADNTTGFSNTAVGRLALQNVTTGANNVGIGFNAGGLLTTGSGNTFIGPDDCGDQISTGSNNTVIGNFNGNVGGLDIRTSSNNIVLSDGDGNPRVFVNSSGSTGIGTTSPSNKMAVVVDSSGTSQATFDGIVVSNSNSTTNNGSAISFAYGGNGNSFSRIGVINTDRSSGSENQDIFFGTVQNGSYSERMRLSDEGSLMLGTDTLVGHQSGNVNSAVALYQTGQFAATSNANDYTCFINKRDNTGGGLIRFRYNGSGVGSITNTTSSTSYNTTSDYRLKENVVDMTDAIDRVKALKPSRFNFIADPDKTVDGFLAHEAQDVVPEAVTGEKDGMTTEEYVVEPALGQIYVPASDNADEQIVSSDVEKPETLADGQQWCETTSAVMGEREVPDYQGIDQAKLVPLLTGALQEAIAKIEILEAKVATLEGN